MGRNEGRYRSALLGTTRFVEARSRGWNAPVVLRSGLRQMGRNMDVNA
jgi:hypothetical protein